MDFDRKKDFRSNFKEEQRSDKAPKNSRKQGEGLHGRAPCSRVVLQSPGPRTVRRTAVRVLVRVPVRGSMAVSVPVRWRTTGRE